MNEIINVYIDSGDPNLITSTIRKSNNPIRGITSNPTLVEKLCVPDYFSHVKHLALKFSDLSVSIQVTTTDVHKLVNQIKWIVDLGPNTRWKLPYDKNFQIYVRKILENGLPISRANFTAIFSEEQMLDIASLGDTLNGSIVSIFCGRISDTGRDPMVYTLMANEIFKRHNVKVLWAGAREVRSYNEAVLSKCQIVTLPPHLIDKLPQLNSSLEEAHAKTINMFSESNRKLHRMYESGLSK